VSSGQSPAPPPSEHPRERAPGGEHPEGERCPLCGAPLHEDQDWCLRCGTAARTRLAPPPRWRPLVLVVSGVFVLSLGGLIAALVVLAGGSGRTSAGAGSPASGPASAPLGAAVSTSSASSAGAAALTASSATTTIATSVGAPTVTVTSTSGSSAVAAGTAASGHTAPTTPRTRTGGATGGGAAGGGRR
jgi:hypothetical protein